MLSYQYQLYNYVIITDLKKKKIWFTIKTLFLLQPLKKFRDQSY